MSSSSLRRLSGTQHLAHVEAQIEGKAVQVESGATGETCFHPPQLAWVRNAIQRVETVFPGQVGAAAYGVVVKRVAAFTAATTLASLANQFAENLLVAEGDNLIS